MIECCKQQHAEIDPSIAFFVGRRLAAIFVSPVVARIACGGGLRFLVSGKQKVMSSLTSQSYF